MVDQNWTPEDGDYEDKLQWEELDKRRKKDIKEIIVKSVVLIVSIVILILGYYLIK